MRSICNKILSTKTIYCLAAAIESCYHLLTML